MSKVTVYNQKGEKKKELDLSAPVFNCEVKPEVVHQAVVTQMANYRDNIADTKDRSEVRGGGRKPWKQKGTGRARHGSSRSPIWVGGGVTFGPTTERNFSKKMNKKARQKAIAMVLSDKIKENNLIVVDKIKLEKTNTKSLIAVYDKLPVKKKKALIVLDTKNEDISRSAKNVQYLNTLPANSLNVVDMLGYEAMIVTEKAIKQIEKTFKVKEEVKKKIKK